MAPGPTYLGHAILEGLSGEDAWPIHCAAIVLRAPAGTVDMNVLWLQAQRLGLNDISDGAVQHSHACTGGHWALADSPVCAPPIQGSSSHLGWALSLPPRSDGVCGKLSSPNPESGASPLPRGKVVAT